MRSTRSLVVVAATILAISACTSAPPAASPTEFHLDKTCVAGQGCTVVSSDLPAFPKGTHLAYTQIGDGSTKVKKVTATVENGTASGECDFNQVAPLRAKCKILTGTGDLAGLHLLADVTVTGNPQEPGAVWHWAGTYWFGD